ncbi:MAG: hypothetical protein Q8P48_00900, partial [Deltaproteobacteria bacterium]|nr:hypothetical protein [Deltaproteobacteria bacterium]
IARQQIELVMRTLTDTDNYIERLRGCMDESADCSGECKVGDLNAGDILEYYVMQKQRDTHLKVVNGGGGKATTEKMAAQSGITFF